MAQLVHARKPVPPRKRVEFGGTIVLGAFAVLEFANGIWQVAIVMAVIAVLLIPVAFVIAGRAVRRHPDWIEVRPDRITALRASGTSWEFVRNDDSTLRVADHRGQPHLYLDGMTSTGVIPLARFDLEEFTQAATAEGWPMPSPTIPPAPPETPSANRSVEQATRVVLRDGERGPLPWTSRGLSPKLVVGLAVVVGMGVMALAFASASPTAIIIAVLGPSIALALALVVISIRHALKVTLTVTIAPDRVSVTHGALASQVVQRTAVTSTKVGRRYARLRGPDGKPLLYVPLNPQRTAVLNALSANGWPV
ncbi:hypothetical protein [Kribbella sindirgiensis]|uniref:PH domain-containing protein n=1 Tax=Kribbella sindirgiensis TaxID=1124744 RepID=A0A4R0IFK0_9ACTN|nr:hypothetical protein [Kribbella sindirgiensis]TCC31307.1 hypothetical protein E0H50_21745 [Kribbella sindirgiensis]